MSKSWTHALKLEAPVTVLEQTCYSGRAHRAESFSRFAFLERKKKKEWFCAFLQQVLVAKGTLALLATL